MTAQELVEILQDCNPDATVYFMENRQIGDETWAMEPCSVTNVTVEENYVELE